MSGDEGSKFPDLTQAKVEKKDSIHIEVEKVDKDEIAKLRRKSDGYQDPL